jgi:hypothetical protein
MRSLPARLWFVLAITLLFSSLASSSSFGEPLLITLDWVVANSESVVRGRLVSDVESNSTSGQIATAEIHETLKGPTMARVRFFSQGFAINPGSDRADDVLLCLALRRGGGMEWATHSELGSRGVLFLNQPRFAGEQRTVSGVWDGDAREEFTDSFGRFDRLCGRPPP